MKHLNHSFSRKIDHKSALSNAFNNVLKDLNCARILSSPCSFSVRSQEMETMFYEICLCELYFHKYISQLLEWKKIIKKYRDEFNYNWKDYATTRRMFSIKEYGGEECDYNGDGTIKMDVSEECLELWSVLDELVPDWNDIVFDTKVSDFQTIFSMIHTGAGFGVDEILSSATGINIPTYKLNEDGSMEERTFIDRALYKAAKQAHAVSIEGLLTGLISGMQHLIVEIRGQNRKTDNREFIDWLDNCIDELFAIRPMPKTILKP